MRFLIMKAGPIFLGAVVLVSFLHGREKILATAGLIQALKDEVSGERAYRYTDAVSKFDRIQASDGYHEAAVWIKNELEKIGYKDVALESWPSDGTKRYATFRSVIGWRVKSAELWLTSPVRERLCSFEETPMTLVKHSGSGRIETRLVDVESGLSDSDYRGRDVKGKIVLAWGPTADVMREAVRSRGAAGVLTYMAPDVRPGHPNMIRYTGLWPRWEEREKNGFAFNISKNQGATLKRMLAEGKEISLRADVSTEFYPSQLEVLSAALPGSSRPEQEIMMIGHLCHPTPSANDNASGSGGLLEMARALKRMTDQGLIEPPRRTVRFVWVPEFNGTIPFVLAHLERLRRTLAVLNCDMIGEDFHKTSGMLGIYRTPDSLPSFLNDVVINFAGLVENLGLTSANGSTHPFAWRSYPFAGGSDHVVFNDASLKIPSVMLNRDDIFHHTNLDDMDKVDSSELRRSCVIALGSALYLAAAGDKQALEIARLVARNGWGRFSADFDDGISSLYDADGQQDLDQSYRQVLNTVAHSGKREIQAVLSASVFLQDEALKPEIAGLSRRFNDGLMSFPKEANLIYKKLCAERNFQPKPMTFSDEEKELGRLVPSRREDFIGPLDKDYLVEKVGREALKNVDLEEEAAYEALNFADGERSLYDIGLALSAEFGTAAPKEVREFFLLLEKAGLVTMKKI